MKQLTILLIIITCKSYAQTAVPAAGGEAFGNTGSVSYSIGQVVYIHHSDSTWSLDEGVQQPFEILEVVGLEKFTENTIHCRIFPNPTTRSITIESEQSGTLTLLDANGKILLSQGFTAGLHPIDMEAFAAATYYLHITLPNHADRRFKIVKN